MRRIEREITDIDELRAVIEQCKVCRLALSENDQPYIIPLNFGYTLDHNVLTLFFHSAREGRKIDILRRNSRACFEIDSGHRLLEAAVPCSHSFAFTSVIGFGTIEFLTDARGKTFALNTLMKHQTGKDIQYHYSEKELDAVCVYKLNISEFTGKKRSP